jgi:glucose/arabinose dehydrogenase
LLNPDPFHLVDCRFPVDQGTGAFYGYPYCFSEYKLPAGVSKGEKTQWAWPGSGKTDAWCRDTNNVKPPVLAMQAHSAPLGITFFDSSLIRQGSCGQGGAFPCDMDGQAFVAFHG